MFTNLTAEYSKWIETDLRPNSYSVVTLNQAIRSQYGTWVKGDPYHYEVAFNQFRARLSQAVYGKRTYFRHKKLIPAAPTLEGGKNGMAWHMNVLMRCPDWYGEIDFEFACLMAWQDIAWAKPDITVERLTGGAIPYSLKDGSEALLVGSMSL